MAAQILAVGNIVETTTVCDLGGQVSMNVRHWRVDAAGGASRSTKQVIDAMSTALAPLYKDRFPNTHYYMGMKIQVIKPTRLPATGSVNGQGVGAVASDPLPDQVAAVVKILSSVVGRSKRGRIYLGGFTEADNTSSNSLSSATLSAINDIMAFYCAPFALGETDNVHLIPVIYSRKLETTTDVNNFSTNTQWGTQRRRSQINSGDDIPVLE